jgi:hypothetical protein
MVNRPAKAPFPLLCRIARIGLLIDEWLRRWHGVYEYSNDPQCIFRIQSDRARRDVALSDGTLLKRGDRMINVHVWNEHVPEVPPEGPTIRWARRWAVAMDESLRQLSDFMAVHPEFDDVAAVRAYSAVATVQTQSQFARIMGHLGLQTIPQNPEISWVERIRRLGENVLGLLFVLAVTPRSARISILRRTRAEYLISRRALDLRYRASRERGLRSGRQPAAVICETLETGMRPPCRE